MFSSPEGGAIPTNTRNLINKFFEISFLSKEVTNGNWGINCQEGVHVDASLFFNVKFVKKGR